MEIKKRNWKSVFHPLSKVIGILFLVSLGYYLKSQESEVAYYIAASANTTICLGVVYGIVKFLSSKFNN